MRRVLIISAAAVLTSTAVVVPAGTAAAEITGDLPATTTAVAVFTADPFRDLSAAPAEFRRALEVAQVRAESNPTQFSPPYLYNATTLVAPVTTTAPTLVLNQAAATILASSAQMTEGDGSSATGSGPDLVVSEDVKVETENVEGVEPTPNVSVFPQTKRLPYSMADLTSVRDEILDQTGIPGFEHLRTAYVQPERNRVVVEAAVVTEEMRQDIATRYGATRVALRLVPGMELAQETSGRWSDTSPFWGGAHFWGSGVSGTCTTGFAWTHEGVSYLLTAGHCTKLEYLAYNPNYSNTTGSYIGTVTADNWNNTTGSVRVYGQSYYSGDVATIRMKSGFSSAPYIYKSDYGYRKVVGAWTLPSGLGDTFCTAGKNTPELCGWQVRQTNVNIKYTSGATIRNATRAYRYGTCIKGGDSGGPIFTKRSTGEAIAKGIISGGSNITSGDCWLNFTDTWLAEKALPGIIKKG